jgi:hypothetical protein
MLYLKDKSYSVPCSSVKVCRGEVVAWLHLFLTSALGGGERLTSGPGRLTVGKEYWCPLKRSQGRTRSGCGRFREEIYLLHPPGFEPRTVQLVPQASAPFTLPWPLFWTGKKLFIKHGTPVNTIQQGVSTEAQIMCLHNAGTHFDQFSLSFLRVWKIWLQLSLWCTNMNHAVKYCPQCALLLVNLLNPTGHVMPQPV